MLTTPLGMALRLQYRRPMMARTTRMILGSTIFLAAVTGLLSPPLPHRGAAPACGTNGRRSTTTDALGNSFDASAWKSIAAIPTLGSESAAPPSVASPAPQREEVVDVDVEKLPTFVFFGGSGGRWLRDEVLGESDARLCRTRLEAKLDSLWDPHVLCKSSEAGEHRINDRAADGVFGPPSAIAGINRDCQDVTTVINGVAINANTNAVNIVEIGSKGDLLKVMSARLDEQGPVVVMYHASWCRKCAYLTPVFRRLAQRAADHIANASRGGDGGISSSLWTRGPLFCRVDVSTWGVRFETAGQNSLKPVAAKRGETNSAVEVGHTEIGEADSGVGSAVEIADHTSGKDLVGSNFLHEGSPALKYCDVCGSSGFVPCGECEGKGAVARSSPDGKHKLAVICPVCVGYKLLRCPSCGGKCYMCD